MLMKYSGSLGFVVQMCVVVIWSSLFHYAFEALKSPCFIMAKDKIQQKLEKKLFNFWPCSWNIVVVWGLVFMCVFLLFEIPCVTLHLKIWNLLVSLWLKIEFNWSLKNFNYDFFHVLLRYNGILRFGVQVCLFTIWSFAMGRRNLYLWKRWWSWWSFC